MTASRSHLSPPYPVLYSLSASPDAKEADAPAAPWTGQGTAYLSLALLVRGIPSFLATLPVDGELLEGIRASLEAGDAQVAVAGISVDPNDVEGMGEAEPGDTAGSAPGGGPREAWMASAGTPPPGLFHVPSPLDGDPPSSRGRAGSGSGAHSGPGGRPLPAAFLSLLCRDGRRLGVARIVSRDPRATPDDVARFVLEKITSGVQVPDLASAG